MTNNTNTALTDEQRAAINMAIRVLTPIAMDEYGDALRALLDAPRAASVPAGAKLPDGSGFMVASLPLPSDHWLYAPRGEWDDKRDTYAETPHPVLTHAQRDQVVAAVRYAVRGATMCGRESDFDPDAIVLNAVFALCGPRGFDLEAAPAAPVAEPIDKLAPTLILTGAQLLKALDFIAPDRAADQLESDVSFQYGNGHDGEGMYCWSTEYPDEGAMKIDGSTVAAQAVAADGAACKGKNCGATDSVSHSAECLAEYEAAVNGAVAADGANTDDDAIVSMTRALQFIDSELTEYLEGMPADETSRKLRDVARNALKDGRAAVSPATADAPLNGIAATIFHGEGAISRCSYCGRYSLDRKTLGDRPPICECGEKHGWSGSFQKPGPDAKWSGAAPAGMTATADERAAFEREMKARGKSVARAAEEYGGAYRFVEPQWDGWQARASQAAAPATKTLSDMQDEIAGVMQQHMDGKAGVVAINTCALEVARHVMQQAAAPAEPFPYQKTFNAIAAATSIVGGHVSISVKAFQDAFGAASADAGEAVLFEDDDERSEFIRAIDEFENHGETDVGYDLLMKWTNSGLLDCEHFRITAAGRAAAQGAQSEGGDA